MKLIINYLVILLMVLGISISCASSRERRWYIKDVAPEKRRWRYCTKERDGEGYHHKGICYITLTCYKKLFGEKCVNKKLHCAFADAECFKANQWPEVARGGDL